MRNSLLPAAVGFLLLVGAGASSQAQVLLSADKVFQLEAARGAAGDLILDWKIEPGTYLYRDKIRVAGPQGEPVEVETPAGDMKDDPSFGKTEIYHRRAQAIVPEKSLADLHNVVVSFQGCAEQGICYPPVTKTVDLETMSVAERTGDVPDAPQAADRGSGPDLKEWAATPVDGAAIPQEEFGLNGSILSTLAAFVGFGLLLAFTPCVFPMIPILSGMLARSGEQLTARRGFVLSATYVAAMSVAYASLGLVVAWSGQNLQVALQTPIALGLMSAIFLALAFSMFGLYDLQLPRSWQSHLIGAGRAHRGGSLGGAAMMGFASALIVGPCVTPPLAAALVYVAQTGNLARGAMALFALGIGMGLPLLAFGTFGAGILPKSGPWLTRVKHAFGLVFVGLAIWMISRVLPTWIAVELWGAGFASAGISLAVSTVLARKHGRSWSARAIAAGLASLVVGAVLIGWSSSGFPRVLDQFTPSTFGSITKASAAEFETVRTPGALDDAIAAARRSGRAVVLDFSAEWCVECKVMDRTVFSDADVLRRLKDFALIRADATDYNEDMQKLMKTFGVVGPPTVIFLGAQDGKEARDMRIVGPVDATTFLKRLDRFRAT
jgi:thiol:disulfide interchange protein DsbD